MDRVEASRSLAAKNRHRSASPYARVAMPIKNQASGDCGSAKFLKAPVARKIMAEIAVAQKTKTNEAARGYLDLMAIVRWTNVKTAKNKIELIAHQNQVIV